MEMHYTNVLWYVLSVQGTFFSISVNWEGGKRCHFSVTNLFILQWSDFWQAGKHEIGTKYWEFQCKSCVGIRA